MFLLFSAALPAETLVRTAYYLEPGLCEKMMDGSYTGASIEYLSLLAKQNNWKISPVFCTYSEALDKLERGEIDLLGALSTPLRTENGSPSPPRRLAFTIPTCSCMSIHDAFQAAMKPGTASRLPLDATQRPKRSSRTT